MEIPLLASTRPSAALCTGETDRSAALISQTALGSNQMSGVRVSPHLREERLGEGGGTVSYV